MALIKYICFKFILQININWRVTTILQYSIQQMDNFNNKTQTQAKPYFPLACSQRTHTHIHIHTHTHTADLYSKQKHNPQKQGNATQCLLMLSQFQHSNKNNDEENQFCQMESFDVTPWANVNFHVKKAKRREGNSQNSIGLPSFCANSQSSLQQNDNKIIMSQKQVQSKSKGRQHKKIKTRLTYEKQNLHEKCQIVMVNKKKNSYKDSRYNKNSHSTIGRYSQYHSQWNAKIQKKYPQYKYHHQYEAKNRAKKNNKESNKKNEQCGSTRVAPKCETNSKSATKCMPSYKSSYNQNNVDHHKQNEIIQIMGQMVPKLQHIYCKSNTTSTGNNRFVSSHSRNENISKLIKNITSNTASIGNCLTDPHSNNDNSRKNESALTNKQNTMQTNNFEGICELRCNNSNIKYYTKLSEQRNALKQRKNSSSYKSISLDRPSPQITLKTETKEYSRDNQTWIQTQQKQKQKQKYSCQYQKIKKQILQNIQKQSQIRYSLNPNVMTKNSQRKQRQKQKQKQKQNRKQSRILCKFLRHNICSSKKQKRSAKTEILDQNYQSSNPITKHLYDRYLRVLDNKDNKDRDRLV